jgi:methanogenic corrinoid protein MtbC1
LRKVEKTGKIEMVAAERKSEIMRLLHDAVVAFDEESSSNLCRQALSALMSTSMLAMPKAIKMLKESVPTVIVMVGGAPLSADIASNMEPMDMQQML